jgi:hypothetical protein
MKIEDCERHGDLYGHAKKKCPPSTQTSLNATARTILLQRDDPGRRALRSRLNADLSCVILGALTRRVNQKNFYSSSTVLKSPGITISSTSQSSE